MELKASGQSHHLLTGSGDFHGYNPDSGKIPSFKISTMPLKFESNNAKIYKTIDQNEEQSALMTSNKNLVERKLDKYFQLQTEESGDTEIEKEPELNYRSSEKKDYQKAAEHQVENDDEMEDLVEDLTKQDRFYTTNVCNICFSKGKISPSKRVLSRIDSQHADNSIYVSPECEHSIFFEQLGKLNPF